jgi:hypothetical protein
VYDQGYSLPDRHVPCKDINILRWLIKKGHIVANEDVLESMAQYGNLECFEYILKLGVQISQRVFNTAINSRSHSIAKFILDAYLYNPHTICLANAICGKPNNELFSILKLFEVSLWPLGVFQNAARGGNLDILQYGYDNSKRPSLTGYEIINYAAEAGHLHVIIWGRERSFKWGSETIMNAVVGNRIDIFKWLRNINNYRSMCKLVSDETDICPWDERVCLKAIKSGNISILKLAIENGCEYGDATLSAVEGCKFNNIKEYFASKNI